MTPSGATGRLLDTDVDEDRSSGVSHLLLRQLDRLDDSGREDIYPERRRATRTAQVQDRRNESMAERLARRSACGPIATWNDYWPVLHTLSEVPIVRKWSPSGQADSERIVELRGAIDGRDGSWSNPRLMPASVALLAEMRQTPCFL